MNITKVDPFTGRLNTLDIPIEEEEYTDYLMGGVSIQRMFPHLTPDEREFIMTGITADSWAETFGEDDE